MSILKKLGTFLNFYKELEEEHKLYYIDCWRRNEKDELVVMLRALPNDTEYESTPQNLYRNKEIFNNLSKDDQDKIALFLEGYGKYKIDSIILDGTKKIYVVTDFNGEKIELKEPELLEKLVFIEKNSISYILKQYLSI